MTNVLKNIIKVLIDSVDARDTFTSGHSKRVTEYSLLIARQMNAQKIHYINPEVLEIAALLHDYGKIAIQDNILRKPGKLTLEEFEEMKRHTTVTKYILDDIDFDGEYRDIPHISSSHHEKMNGGGYPNGIKGDEIPMMSRIIAVADVFDALTSKRAYRDKMSFHDALVQLQAKAGTHLDKSVLDSFFRIRMWDIVGVLLGGDTSRFSHFEEVYFSSLNIRQYEDLNRLSFKEDTFANYYNTH